MSLSYTVWNSLPLATRVKIAAQFGIAKIGPTHVVNNEIASDGYKFQDVEKALTTEALQTFVDSDETDYPALFKMMLDKLENPTVFEPTETAVVEGSGTVTEKLEVKSTPVKVKKVTRSKKK